MGVDTKGFVVIPKSKQNVFEIARSVERSIIAMMYEHPTFINQRNSVKNPNAFDNKPFMFRKDAKGQFVRYCDMSNDEWYKLDPVFTRPTLTLASSLHMIVIPFVFNCENRNLKIFFSCDSDHSDINKNSKVIFDLSCWGSSREIIKRVVNDVAIATKSTHAYFVGNDCVDKWEQLELK